MDTSVSMFSIEYPHQVYIFMCGVCMKLFVNEVVLQIDFFKVPSHSIYVIIQRAQKYCYDVIIICVLKEEVGSKK